MKKTILAFLSIWGWIILGTFASVLYHGSHLRSFLVVVAIPVFAAIIAATGPLAIIVCMLYLYRVQGGSFVAISSLIVGSALLYSVLIWGVRAWLKAESILRRLLFGFGLMCYSAFATHCLLYVSARM